MTHIVAELINKRACSTTESLSFQLPLNAQVTGLKTTSLPGTCEMKGLVKAETQGQQNFAESASQGRPAALLQAYDSTNHGVELSLLPEGPTVLEITSEELLLRQRGQVDFQVPVFPSLPVEFLTFNLSI